MKKSNFWLPLGLLILLLALLIVLSISLTTLSSFSKYKIFIKKDITLTYDRFKFLFKDTLQKEWIKHTSPDPLADKQSQLKTFRITLKKQDIDLLNSDLPRSGKKDYIQGYMKVSDAMNIVYKIKLRYRGDSFLHWFYGQKSLRIKLNKSQIYNQSVAFNLINPPHDFSIIDCVAYDISSALGLISPKYEPVRVFINNRFMGVYIYLSQVDESLLRSHARMPGSIYYGDISSNDETNLQKPAKLFYDKNLWIKKSSRNSEQKQNQEDIELFTKILTLKDKQKFENFANTVLDLDKYYIFLALDTLFGSFHHDWAHNHKLYFDPYKGKFEPIQWDLRYWSASRFKDNSLYPLQQQIKQNPIFEAKRDKVAYTILKNYPAKKIVKILQEYQKKVLPDIQSDIYRDTAKRPKEFINGISTSFSIKEFQTSIKNYENSIIQREKILYNIYDNSKLSYMMSRDKLFLKVDGNSPVNLITKYNTITTLYPSRKKVKLENSSITFLYGTHRLMPSPSYYHVDKSDIKEYRFENYITGKKVIPKKEDFSITKITTIPVLKKQKTVILDGVIEVDKTLMFDSHTDVIIKAGTIFIISSNKSIYFYAKVIAKGTKEKPIKFIAKDINKPWGVVTIQGKDSSNSHFEYCFFEDGSVDTKNLIRYTAQFNIHDTLNFKVINSYIGRNFLGDDSMHIAYSTGSVEGCSFTDARSDALDIDISDVNITNNIFKNAKNDALDIMNTTMTASKNSFINSGDKGISVGEASTAIIEKSYFIDNFIGLEVKDNSKVKACNLIFKDSKKLSINLYHKNKRYSKGGFLTAKNITFLTKKLIKVDKKSNLKIDK